MSEAKSKNFMLSSATVMIGEREKLMELNPSEHSIGLVKNFNVNNDRSSTDLTAGVTNDLVFTMTTGSETRASMEMYEYTAKNMAYALGLSGFDISEVTGDPFIVNAIGTNNSDKTHDLVVTEGSTPQPLADGDMISIRFPDDDNIILAKATDTSGVSSTGALTVQVDIGAVIIPAGSVIQRVSVLELGTTEEQTELAAKVTGQLADGTWITLLNPRIKVSSGFAAAFSSENYGNMAFEWKNLKVLPGEPFYADYKGMAGKLLKDATASKRT
jgi:hypothetical protein